MPKADADASAPDVSLFVWSPGADARRLTL